MKKILVKVAVLVSAVTLVCSCEKKSVDPQNNSNNQENQVENRWDNDKWTSNVLLAKNGEDSIRSVQEFDADGKRLSTKTYYGGELGDETTYSYNGLVVTMTMHNYRYVETVTTIETTYKDAALTLPVSVVFVENGQEVSRSDYEYDGNRLIGEKYYEDGVLVGESKNFNYSQKECSYTYEAKNAEESYISKTVYADENQTIVLSETTLRTDGMTELQKSTYQYDEQGRMTQYQSFAEGKLVLEYVDFKYDGKKCQYTENVYYGEISFSHYYQKTFF